MTPLSRCGSMVDVIHSTKLEQGGVRGLRSRTITCRIAHTQITAELQAYPTINMRTIKSYHPLRGSSLSSLDHAPLRSGSLTSAMEKPQKPKLKGSIVAGLKITIL